MFALWGAFVYTASMKKLFNLMAGSFKALWLNIFAALLMLIGLRFFALTLNLGTVFGGMFRVSTQTDAIYTWLIYLVLAALILIVQKNYPALPNRVKNRFLLFYTFSYSMLAILNNRIMDGNYFYLVTVANRKLSDIWELLFVDLFFDSPYVCWGLGWMLVIYHVSRRYNLDKYLILLWSMPFIGLTLHGNNLTLIFILASLITGLVGNYVFKGRHIKPWFLFQGVVIALVLAYLYYRPGFSAQPMVVAVMALVAAVWLGCFLFIRSFHNCRNQIAWLTPVFFAGILSQLIPLSYLHLWFLSSQLVFVGTGALLAVLHLFLIVALLGLVLPKMVRPIFNTLFVPVALFFVSDAIVLYMTGLRLTRHTLLWVQSYLASVIKAANTMVDWQFLLIILSLPFLFIVLTRFLKNKAKTHHQGLASLFVFITLTMSSSTLIYQVFKHVQRPMLSDAYHFFLASLPTPKFMQPARPDMKELLAGFAASGVNLTRPESSDTPTPKAKPMNLVLIMLESVNNRYLSLFGHEELTMPKMAKFKDRMEIFPLFFSNFPESSNADVSLMTGLYPPPYIYLLDKIEYRADTLIDSLKRAEYHCSLFSSGFISDSGLAPFYRSQKYDAIHDPETLENLNPEDIWTWGVKKHVMINRIVDSIAERSDNDQPFFIYFRTAFPHAPFRTVTGDHTTFDTSDIAQGSYVGRFKNCMLYLDEQFARLIDEIDAMGISENTIVAFVGDHGTMMGEDEYSKTVGHGTNLAPELANVPFIIIHPQGYGQVINPTPCSFPDVKATLLNVINLKNDSKSLDQGRDLRQSASDSRPIFLASLAQRAIIEGENYYQFPYAESTDAQVFNISLDGMRPVFKRLPATSPNILARKHQEISRFFSLQTHLMSHIEEYEAELSSLEPTLR